MTAKSESTMPLLRFVQIEEIECKDRLRLEAAAEGLYRFVLMTAGTAKLSLLHAGQEPLSALVSAGEVLLLPPAYCCEMARESDAPATLQLIAFEAAGGGLESYVQAKVYRTRLPLADRYLGGFRGQHARTIDPASYYRLQSQLYAIAAEFAAELHAQADKEEDLVDYVERTKRYMTVHYNQEVDVETLARLSGASSSRFYQAFRRIAGHSPNKFIMERRLQASLALLADSAHSVTEVAHAVGYQDEYYFSRLFKKQLGLSPSEYAIRSAKRVANLSPVFAGDLSVLGIRPVISLERGWSREPDCSIPAIRESRPELILTSPIPDDVHRMLLAICPVIVLQWKRTPWQQRLLAIGDAVGLRTVAAHWLASFEGKANNARELIDRRFGGEPFLLIGVFADRYRVYGLHRSGEDNWFYREPVPAEVEAGAAMAFIDVETLGDLAEQEGHHAIFLVQDTDSEDACAELEASWRSLRRHVSTDSPRCLCIRVSEKLLYNAAVHECVINSAVDRLVEMEQGRLMKSPSRL